VSAAIVCFVFLVSVLGKSLVKSWRKQLPHRAGGTAPLASGFACSLHTELALIATVNLFLACNLCMLSLPSPWIETEAVCGEDQEVHRECEAMHVCTCVAPVGLCTCECTRTLALPVRPMSATRTHSCPPGDAGLASPSHLGAGTGPLLPLAPSQRGAFPTIPVPQPPPTRDNGPYRA